MPTNRNLRAVAGQGAYSQYTAILNVGSLIGGLICAFNSLPVLKPIFVHYMPKNLMNVKLDMNLGPIRSVNISDGLVLFVGFVIGYALSMVLLVILMNVVFKLRGAVTKGTGE